MESTKEMPVYLTENEVARMTGIALSTLRNWRFQKRGFPYTKVGRAIRYRLDDVIQFMEERRVAVEGF